MTGSALLHCLRYIVGVDQAHTQTTPKERERLAYHAKRKCHLVEIGVYEGVTTRLLADHMATQGTLYAVDPFMRGRLGICWARTIARREIQKAKAGQQVQFIEKFSHEAASEIDGEFDFVFVDGDHSLNGITRDWEDWSWRIQPLGLIALHDTRVPEHNPRVAGLGSVAFFEETIRHDTRFELIEQVDSLSFLRRHGNGIAS